MTEVRDHLGPLSLSDRIAAYREDGPLDGRHSDAAGANAYELLDEANDEISALLAERDKLKAALEAVQAEIVLTGQLADVVDAALSLSSGDGNSASGDRT